MCFTRDDGQLVRVIGPGADMFNHTVDVEPPLAKKLEAMQLGEDAVESGASGGGGGGGGFGLETCAASGARMLVVRAASDASSRGAKTASRPRHDVAATRAARTTS